MDESVRKPLTFLAAVGALMGLGLFFGRVTAVDTFQSYFGAGKDLGTKGEVRTQAALVYKVEPGDAWWKIARDHNVSTRALLAANGATLSTSLVTGQNIRLPGPDAATP